MARTLYDKVFDDHVVDMGDDGTATMYIDRHIVHEVTSPQAFEGLANLGRKVRRTDCTLATVDHNVPTTSRKSYKDSASFINEADSRLQVLTLEDNVKKFGVPFFGMTDARQGIVHVIGPEEGFTLPGATIVCGDSHTSTHGAFGSLAFGIGTSEVEHVLATQTILQRKSKNMKIQVDGELAPGVASKDVMLHIIGVIGTAGGTGCVMELCGSTIRGFSMEARMSMCNMSIEAGARAGMVAPDEKTFEYVKGRPLAPKGEEWDKAVEYWKTLKSDPDAKFDVEVYIDAKDIAPTLTWGTSPQDVVPITGHVSNPDKEDDPKKKAGIERALNYQALTPDVPMVDLKIDRVFIGSCTNSRIEDLRLAASIVSGTPGLKVAPGVQAMVVPGSGLVKAKAEQEGLDKIFSAAGFDWREAGCSMCLGMNPDILSPGQRCASTSNRNFEGRQGPGGRTHLMSPSMAAAAAVSGHFVDVRDFAVNKDVLNPKSVEVEARVEQDSKPATNSSADTNGAAPAEAAPASEEQPSKKVKKSTGGLAPFTTLESVAAPLDRANVDTDLIIPARFLKTIKRTGLGVSLFSSIRYNPDGSENPDFVLNKEPYRHAKILVVKGGNFGCGSSREHAPWALMDFGIRCVIASSFADIFNNNMYKNGNLPVVLPEEQVSQLFDEAAKGTPITVDLPNQRVTCAGLSFEFDVTPLRKYFLVNGLDDIGVTLQKEDKINTFEGVRTKKFPWLDGIGINGKFLSTTAVAAAIGLDW